MVSAHANVLLQALGKPILSESSKGILEPGAMPAALETLRNLPSDAQPSAEEQDDEEPARAVDEPVSLRKRAWPLAQMIERALAANEPIVWGV